MMIGHSWLALALFFASAAAQGVLTNGNSQFPACAQSCQLVNQAAQACGGTANSDQGTWGCFCQSAYLKPLYTSPAGICDATCPNAADSQQLMTWYKSNCGTDNGAKEHATASTTNTGSTGSTGGGTSGGTSTGISVLDVTDGGTWWQNHYQWVIMLIVLAICLPLLALLATCLKRRYERKQDRMYGGFNAGITERSAPMSQNSPQLGVNPHGGAAAEAGAGNRPASPVRTREAFMPYGYGYARSESRASAPSIAAQRQDTRAATSSPLAREVESTAETSEGNAETSKKRIRVREREDATP